MEQAREFDDFAEKYKNSKLSVDNVNKLIMKHIINYKDNESFSITYKNLVHLIIEEYGDKIFLLNPSDKTIQYLSNKYSNIFNKYKDDFRKYNSTIINVLKNISYSREIDSIIVKYSYLSSDNDIKRLDRKGNTDNEHIEYNLNDIFKFYNTPYELKHLIYFKGISDFKNDKYKDIDDLYIKSLMLFREHSETGGLSLMKYVFKVYFELHLDIPFNDLVNLYSQITEIDNSLYKSPDNNNRYNKNIASLRSMMALLEFEELQLALKESQDARINSEKSIKLAEASLTKTDKSIDIAKNTLWISIGISLVSIGFTVYEDFVKDDIKPIINNYYYSSTPISKTADSITNVPVDTIKHPVDSSPKLNPKLINTSKDPVIKPKKY